MYIAFYVFHDYTYLGRVGKSWIEMKAIDFNHLWKPYVSADALAGRNSADEIKLMLLL